MRNLTISHTLSRRRWFAAFLTAVGLVFALVMARPAAAQQVVWNTTWPYFSGTNASLPLKWYWTSYREDRWFTGFWITVTGARKQGASPTTTEIFRESYNWQCRTINFKVAFDTTEFAHASVVVVRTYTTDNAGNTYVSVDRGKVWNKAVTWKHWYLPAYENQCFYRVTTQANYLCSGRYGVVGVGTLGNTNKTSLLQELRKYTVIHINDHGAAGTVADLNDPNWVTGISIQGIDEVAPEVEKKTTLNTKYPPYSFVFITACHALGEPNEETGQVPDDIGFQSGFGITGPNQALLGFKNFTNGLTCLPWTEGVMENMFLHRLTAEEAIQAATDAYGKPKGTPDQPSTSTKAAILRAVFGDDIDPHLFGDPKTKVRGLYVVPRGTVTWARVDTNPTY